MTKTENKMREKEIKQKRDGGKEEDKGQKMKLLPHFKHEKTKAQRPKVTYPINIRTRFQIQGK